MQFVLFSLTAYGCVQVLASWSRYAALGMGTQLVVREFIPAALVTVSLIGLWRTRRWGLILALIVDGAFCAQTLWFLVEFATVARNARLLASNLWEFAALAVLLSRPVRGYFLGRNAVPPSAATSLVGAQSGAHQARKPLRILIYFAVAVVATCVFTAFTLALFIGQKSGGGRGFLVILYLGFTTGCVASFLFALILTLLARKLGPTRLWLWLLLGGSLAPSLIFVLALLGNVLALLGNRYSGPGPLSFVLWGPQSLLQVWWLTPPTGVFTAWICYAMYPWSFQ